MVTGRVERVDRVTVCAAHGDGIHVYERARSDRGEQRAVAVNVVAGDRHVV